MAMTAPGKCGTSSCRRRGHDDAHAAFHLHDGGDVEDDAVQGSAIEQAAFLHHFGKAPALMMQHAIFVTRARDAAGDGFAQDADDVGHLRDDFLLGEVAASTLILDGELPERRVFVARRAPACPRSS
jgi:hypothetical protein